MFSFLSSLLFICTLFLVVAPQIVHASNLVINEIMAKPDDDTEWVELYNPTNQEIDLNGWTIKDGNTSPTDDISLTEKIGALGFKVFEHKKGWLNDSGDTVTLLNGTTEIDVYTFDTATQGKTIGRQTDGNDWTYNLTPSKGVTNGNSPTPTPTESPAATPTPSNTPTPTNKPTPTPTIKPPTSTPKMSPAINKSPTPDTSPSFVLGSTSVSDISPTIAEQENKEATNPLKNLFLIGGGLVLTLAGVLIITFIVKNRASNI